MGILQHHRVLELSDGWTATTLAARLLAELGAEVVKLEAPEGDSLRQRQPFTSAGCSYAFEVASALKQSVIAESAGDGFHELASSCDVLLIEAETWRRVRPEGVTLDHLAQAHPHLVICAISPHGLQAPESEWGWSELALQASTGMMTTTGYVDDPPTRIGVPIITHGTASCAALAVLAALHERRQSGLGQFIDLAGYDVSISFLGTFLPVYFRDGKSAQRDGNRHPLAVPWNAYPTRDGWAIICSMGDSAWLRLLEAIGRDDLKTDTRFLTALGRLEHVEEVDALLSEWTRQYEVASAADILLQANVPIGPILPVDQFIRGDYCRERELKVEVPHGDAGEMSETLGPMFKLSQSPGMVGQGAPGLGQNQLDRAGPIRPPSAGQPGASAHDKPFKGIRIVEMAAYTAAPYGTRLLGVLGAEIIKVEPAKGDPMRHLATPLVDSEPDSYVFHLYNTDKKSVTLNPSTPEGKALLLDLLQTSHVFVHNLSYDLMEKMGLTYDALRQTHPGLIYAVASGFGQRGEWRNRRAFDTILQAFGGLMDVTGRPDKPPVRGGISMVDLFGALFTATSVAAAIHHQRETGEGQLVDVALGDVAAWLACESWPLALAGGTVERLGNRHWFAAPHNLYQTRDRDIVLAVEQEAQWDALLLLMGREELRDEPRFATAAARVQVVEEVDTLVQTWLLTQTSTEALAQCRDAGIPASWVKEVGEAAEDAMAGARETILEYETHKLLGAPFRFSRSAVGMEALAPSIGQHNDAIYREVLGLSATDIEHLKAQGAI